MPRHEPAILAIRTAVPEHVMTQSEAIELASRVCARTPQDQRVIQAMFRRAGVERRHTCIPYQTAYGWIDPATPDVRRGPGTAARMRYFEQFAPGLTLRAAEEALAATRLHPRELTHIIVATCTGFFSPGIDAMLIERLGLRPSIERIQVGYMGCHAAINALRVARALVKADPSARVLVCAVELCSLHYQLSMEPDQVVGNAIFGDGAAVAIVAEGPGLLNIVDTGSVLLADTADAMRWEIGDDGFLMTLSARVPDLIREHLHGWLSTWLAERGTSVDEVGSWAIHPGGPRIVTAAGEALGLHPDAVSVSRRILRDYGNMSSPTVLFILQELLRDNAARPCVVLGFGPGLVIEAALLR